MRSRQHAGRSSCPGRFITLAWEEIDRPPSQKLAAAKLNGGKVRALISSITHPTSWETIVKLLSQFADGQHIVYQAALTSAICDADLRSHHIAAINCYLQLKGASSAKRDQAS